MANLASFNQMIATPRTQTYLTEVLKENKESFVTSLVSVVANNASLQACEPVSLMYAAMKATALKLPFDPNLGFAYVIPYSNKGKMEGQFQLGYKGFIQLAMRSGQFACINADCVYDGELKGSSKLTGEIQLDGEKKSDTVIGYFAYFKLLNGFEKTLYMDVNDINKHAKRFSQTAKRGYGLWTEKDSFDAMAKKTVLKLLLSKYAPLSIDMQQAIKADQAVIRGDKDSDMEYVDNQEDTSVKDTQVSKVADKARAIKERLRKTATAKVDEQPQPYEDALGAEETPMPEDGDLLDGSDMFETSDDTE